MSSVSVTDLSQTQNDVFKKPVNLPTTITLSQEKIERIRAGETPANPQLSQEAIDKSEKEMLQTRNSIIELNQSKTNAIVNDIDTYFSGMLSQSSLSSLDMGGLISEALQTPGGSGNSTTLSMDLSLTQAKLNFLAQKFVPIEHQAASVAEINNYLAKKTDDQDDIVKDMTSRSLAIAKQYGDTAGEKSLSEQLMQLNAGQHETQNERRDMLSLTNSITDSSVWFTGLRQRSGAGNETDFFKDIASSHVAKLQQQWEKFTTMVSVITA